MNGKYGIYVLLVQLLSIAVMVTFVFEYTQRQITENDRKFCAAIASVDDAYTENPPTTQAGKNIAERWHELRAEFQC